MRSLTDAATYELARRQGYRRAVEPELRRGRRVGGMADLVDIVVLAC